MYKLIKLVMVHLKLSGYRMAAECARNALLGKVVDNKADLGNMPISSYHFNLSLSCMRLLNIFFYTETISFRSFMILKLCNRKLRLPFFREI